MSTSTTAPAPRKIATSPSLRLLPLPETVRRLIFEKISRPLLSCALDAFDAIPPRQRNRIFDQSLLANPDQPIDEAKLVSALGKEILHRVGDQVFDNPLAAEEERPGRIRVFKPGVEEFFSHVRICRINDLRTANFSPPLNQGDYLPAEIQQDCAPVVVNGQPLVVCQVRTANCPGNMIVLEVAAGDGVILTGVNYFSVDAKVRFSNKDTGAVAAVAG